MGNVLRVLKRDVLRLLKTPPALVVVLALLVLPSVYTWYNVVGFWDPYNNTGELRVGDMIVDELRGNTQLDWVFVDRDDAMAELDAGKSYAAFVIPSGFTSQLLSLTTGDFTQPKLEYYVNEKAGPVAPKITDTGASTLDETINSTFVSTVISGSVYTVCLFLFAGADASALVAYVPIVLCTAVINTVIVQALYLPLRKVLKKGAAAPAGAAA